MQWLQRLDARIISRLRKLEVPVARTAIFTVYFWFGLLKLFGESPAAPLVQNLFERTIPAIPFEAFYIGFSAFEVSIGILFLVRGAERLAIAMLGMHLLMTFLPLILLPHLTWQGPFAPTLEGQYIIKNILIAASAIVVGAKLAPIR